MEPITVATLKSFDTLKGVPDEQLQWLINNCEDHVLPEGTLFIKPDVPISGPHFIIEVDLIACLVQNGSKRELVIFGPGIITGYLPYSRGMFASFYMKAKAD